MQPGYGHGRTLRLFAVGMALLFLLALVAVGSRSGFGHTTNARATPGYVSWAMSIFLVLFVVMIPVAAWAYSVGGREFMLQNKRKRSMQSRIIRSLAIIGFIMFLFGARQFAGSHGLLPAFHAPWLHHGKGRGSAATSGNHYNPTFQWPVLWAFLAVLAVTVAWGWWAWRKRAANPPAVEEAATIEEDVVATIGDAIDDLEAEPDARRAVIAAYARMEKVLGRHGLHRTPSETALEYLQRILLGLTSRTDAVTQLTRLFERAKFSKHEVDTSMKQDAISSLRAIRDDLQRAPA